jgi:hypothetical protein
MPWYVKAPHRSRAETAVFVAAIVLPLVALAIIVSITLGLNY